MVKSKVEKPILGQPAFIEAYKANPNGIILIDGYKYIKVDDTLIPQYGKIAKKSDIIGCEKSSLSTWVKAVKILNGVK